MSDLKQMANRVYAARWKARMTYWETGEMFIRKEWVKDIAEFEQLMLDIEEMESR